jgi:hypothetical protein
MADLLDGTVKATLLEEKRTGPGGRKLDFDFTDPNG